MNSNSNRMTFDQFRKIRKEIDDKQEKLYVCVCGTPTNELCPNCSRPNCMTGYHSHFCATTQKMQLG